MLTFVDTETTAKPSGKSKPRMCQLTVIFTDNALKTRGIVSSYVYPVDWHVPKSATAFHGITQEACEDYGLKAKSLLKAFAFYAGKSDLVVAHNAGFDKRTIEGEMEQEGILPPETEWFCTMKESTDIVKLPHANGRKGYKWPKLAEAFKYFTGNELENAHDALHDTRACREVYRGILKHRQTEELDLVA